MKNIILILFLTISPILKCYSKTQNLIDILKQTVNKHPNLAEAKYQIKQTVALKNQVNADFIPQIIFESEILQAGNITDKENDMDDPAYVSIKLAWNAISFKSFYKYEEARLKVKSTKLKKQWIKQDLIRQISLAYLDLLEAQEIAKLIKSKLNKLKSYHRDTYRSFQLGDRTLTDVRRAKVRSSLLKAEWLEAKENILLKESDFFAISGIKAPEIINIDQFVKMKNYSVKAFNENMVKNVIDLKIIDNDLSVLAESIKAEKSSHLPMLTFFSDYKKDWRDGMNLNESNINTSEYEIGARITMPIYSGSRYLESTKEAVYKSLSLKRRRISQTNKLSSELQKSIERLNFSKEIMAAYSQATSSAKQALKGMITDYRGGSRSILELLDAEEDLSNAREQLKRREIQTYKDIIDYLWYASNLSLKGLDKLLISNRKD